MRCRVPLSERGYWTDDETADAVLELLRSIADDVRPVVPAAALDPARPVWPEAPSVFDRGGPLYRGDAA